MSKLKKLVLVTAALGALAVGGAAYAGAQSVGTVAKVTVQKSSPAAEAVMSGDTDRPDSASAADLPDGPGDQADGPSDGESPGS
ncbi:MAG TPA: hypothetical protein VGO13_03825 [Solirubrobacterales bacterium]|jgi:hypothetical protein|nr:hypothetical protein [Solirubrobacterales bacterium]